MNDISKVFDFNVGNYMQKHLLKHQKRELFKSGRS